MTSSALHRPFTFSEASRGCLPVQAQDIRYTLIALYYCTTEQHKCIHRTLHTSKTSIFYSIQLQYHNLYYLTVSIILFVIPPLPHLLPKASASSALSGSFTSSPSSPPSSFRHSYLHHHHHLQGTNKNGRENYPEETKKYQFSCIILISTG